MRVDKYLLFDSEEGFYDVYFFEEEVDVEELKTLIKNHIKNTHDELDCGAWDLDTIKEEIKKHYKVKYVLLFDYIARKHWEYNRYA